MKWFGCFPHILNLVVNDGLKQATCQSLLNNVREIVGYIRRSGKASGKLTNMQNQLGVPVHKLLNDCVTRWSLTYIMLERFIEQGPAIQFVLRDLKKEAKYAFITESELDELEGIRDLIHPFYEVTVIMSAEKRVLASSVIITFFIVVVQHLHLALSLVDLSDRRIANEGGLSGCDEISSHHQRSSK